MWTSVLLETIAVHTVVIVVVVIAAVIVGRLVLILLIAIFVILEVFIIVMVTEAHVERGSRGERRRKNRLHPPEPTARPTHTPTPITQPNTPITRTHTPTFTIEGSGREAGAESVGRSGH